MYWAINPDPHTRGVIFSLNGADEFMMLIKPERGHSGVDTVKVADWVKRTIGADIAVEVLAYHPWHAGQALVAERYRAGRIFIAGDAAHLFTPTGGFGMNTGITTAQIWRGNWRRFSKAGAVHACSTPTKPSASRSAFATPAHRANTPRACTTPSCRIISKPKAWPAMPRVRRRRR